MNFFLGRVRSSKPFSLWTQRKGAGTVGGKWKVEAREKCGDTKIKTPRSSLRLRHAFDLRCQIVGLGQWCAARGVVCDVMCGVMLCYVSAPSTGRPWLDFAAMQTVVEKPSPISHLPSPIPHFHFHVIPNHPMPFPQAIGPPGWHIVATPPHLRWPQSFPSLDPSRANQ